MSDTGSSGLAIDGGPKIRKEPFPPRRLFGEEEKAAANRVFDAAIESGKAFGYNGQEQQAYEAEFSELMGGGHSVAVSSGTAAVFCALGGLDMDVAREIVVPPITDPGGVMPVCMLNCIPVVADAAPGSFNAGPEQIEAVITERTAAIIVAHIAGEPVDMDPVMELARARGIPVIEDAAQSHLARYKGRLVGTLGDVAVFSTMSGKHHATGAQGGIVWTRDEDLIWRVKRFSDRGKPLNLPDACGNVTMGLNCNQNDLAAAIGRVQIKKLPGFVKVRRKLAASIREGMKELKAVSVAEEPSWSEGVYWFLRVRLDEGPLKVDKKAFVEALSAEGLPVGEHYTHATGKRPWFLERRTYGGSGCPWTCPLYEGDSKREFPLPNAHASLRAHFIIYFHEGYGENEVRDIVAALRKVEKAYLS